MSTPRRVEFAHALRGIAALLVVCGHLFFSVYLNPRVAADLVGLRECYEGPPPAALAWAHRNLPFHPGHLGVALFFLLSGFVIPYSLRSQEPGPFLVSRVFRLWPAYAVALALTLGGLWLLRVLVADPGPSWPGHKPILHHLLFMRDMAGHPMLDGIVWTLEVEVKFYLFCALIAASLRAGHTLPLVLFAAAGAAVVCWTKDESLTGVGLGKARLFLQLTQTGFQMITYMLLGVLFHYHHQRLIGTAKALVIGGALLASFAFQWRTNHLSPGASLGVLNYGYALAAFWACYLSRERLGPSALLSWLADVSYPLYLLHGYLGYAFLTVFLRAWDRPYLALGLAFALVFCLSWLLHRLVEVPSNAAGKRIAAWLSDAPVERQEAAPVTPAPPRMAA